MKMVVYFYLGNSLILRMYTNWGVAQDNWFGLITFTNGKMQ